MGIERKHRGWMEKIVLLVLFLGLLGFVSFTYMKGNKATKEKVLYFQLENLRQGVSLFQLVEKKYPKGLIELAAAVYKMPGSSDNQKFVNSVTIGKEGKVVDPFGTPYDYDPVKGWVKSQTEGYTTW